MWGPNPPYIYFAGDSLACVCDTRALALRHGLIWRSLYDNLYELHPGDRLLLVFWKTDEKRFVPLARFRARAVDISRGEQPTVTAAACYGVIPQQLRQDFLSATPGVGGDGYSSADNPDFTAICVEKMEGDAVDLIWQGVAAGPHDLPPAQYRYGWGHPTRPALRHFDPAILVAPLLPSSMYP